MEQVIQIVALVAAVALVLPLGINSIKKFIGNKKKKPNDFKPIKNVELELDDYNKQDRNLSDLVEEWEHFKRVLELNKLTKCAEQMKGLLTQMFTEYNEEKPKEDIAGPQGA